jgi:hypothetical protein
MWYFYHRLLEDILRTRLNLRPHSHRRPSRAELNRAELTIHIASRAYPNWKHCRWHFWTARMSNEVHVFSLTDNIWWRSLLCTRRRRFWVHTHFNPRKLDLLRNRIGRRLASKNKRQPGNTFGQSRSGSVRLGSADSVNEALEQGCSSWLERTT